jgi:hypothetical protein
LIFARLKALPKLFEAEVLFLGEQAEDSDGGDREFIDWFLTNPVATAMGADSFERLLRQQARTLCVEHAGRIQAVADALLERGWLSDADIRAIAEIPRPVYDGRLIPAGGWRPCEGVRVG